MCIAPKKQPFRNVEFQVILNSYGEITKKIAFIAVSKLISEQLKFECIQIFKWLWKILLIPDSSLCGYIWQRSTCCLYNHTQMSDWILSGKFLRWNLPLLIVYCSRCEAMRTWCVRPHSFFASISLPNPCRFIAHPQHQCHRPYRHLERRRLKLRGSTQKNL